MESSPKNNRTDLKKIKELAKKTGDKELLDDAKRREKNKNIEK